MNSGGVHPSYAEAGCNDLNLLSNKAPFIEKRFSYPMAKM
jgi:hypothetical protein